MSPGRPPGPEGMGKLVYSSLASLDGYVADASGRWDWAVPDEEVLAFLNAAEAGIGTYLYGRRIYELMTAWETDPATAAQSDQSDAFASMWQRAEKVVYSTTLTAVTTERTRLEPAFEPDAVRRLVDAAPHDVAVAGAVLAATAFRAGLVDELQLFLAPVLVGGGKRLFPDAVHVPLELTEERRFANGMTFLRYAVLR